MNYFSNILTDVGILKEAIFYNKKNNIQFNKYKTDNS